jgi:uncharacterized protein
VTLAGTREAATLARGPDPAADRAVARLESRIGSYGRPAAVVAFSGGVDSATVLAVAARALGGRSVQALTAVSPSYPEGELEHARDLAAALGVEHVVVATRELEREAYTRNDGERCFHCKTELYATIRRLAAEASDGVVVMAGANADDAADFRPGLRAGSEQGVRNPLLEERLGKDAVRAVARHLGLSVADKPALACLSSRVAFGLRITPDLLRRIDRAEQLVRAMGFGQVRVRHLGGEASIEVPSSEVGPLLDHPNLPELRRDLQVMGWERVHVDLRGYRGGSMNETLPAPGRPTAEPTGG